MKTKTCSGCSKRKRLDRFYIDRHGFKGRKSKCIECCTKRDKAHLVQVKCHPVMERFLMGAI